MLRFATFLELAAALQRAQAAHHDYELRTGVKDNDWPAWYANFIAEEQEVKPMHPDAARIAAERQDILAGWDPSRVDMNSFMPETLEALEDSAKELVVGD